MTHKFAIVVDKNFYEKIQNNSDFYLRVLTLDVIRALSDEAESAEKYHASLFLKCAQSIAKEVRFFADENGYIFYLELSSGYLENIFEEPLDDFE
jgi:hypothetical protein